MPFRHGVGLEAEVHDLSFRIRIHPERKDKGRGLQFNGYVCYQTAVANATESESLRRLAHKIAFHHDFYQQKGYQKSRHKNLPVTVNL